MVSYINIDPSVLQERTDTYSSLTDINGANVFTDAYEQRVQQYEQNSQKIYNTAQQSIFVAEMTDRGDIYDRIESELFTGTQTQVVKETVISGSDDLTMAIPIIGIAVVVTLILLVRYTEKRRRRWTSNEADDYAYE